MKFIAKRAELLALAKKVCKAVPAKSVVEILSGMLIEADADTLEVSLTATNYEVAVQCKLDCCVEEGGGAVIDARLFVQMLSLLGDETVSVQVSSSHLCTLVSGTAVYDVMTRPGREYPKPEIPFPENAFKLSHLCSAAKNTVFATAKDKSKETLEGVHVAIDGDQARFCGCDGRRLMERRQTEKNRGRLNVIVPARAFGTLAGMVKDSDILELGVIGKTAVFTKEGLLFSAKLITGEYIDVDKIFQDTQLTYAAAVNAKEMAQALDNINIVAGNTGPVNMEFSEGEVKLLWQGKAGKSQITLNADIEKNTPPGGFLYAVDLLREAFRHLGGKQVSARVSPIGAVVVQTEQDRYLQLPMRRQQNNAKAA